MRISTRDLFIYFDTTPQLVIRCSPEVIEKEEWSEAVPWKNEQDQWYQRMYNEGREHIQHALLMIPAEERGIRLLHDELSFFNQALSPMPKRLKDP